MKDKWEELFAVLSKMLSIYQAILTLSQQKQQILIAAKSHDLEIVTKQEEILIMQVGKLEDVRGKLVSELMASHGIPEDEVSVAQLNKIAPLAVAEQLEHFAKEFRDIMTALMPMNKTQY